MIVEFFNLTLPSSGRHLARDRALAKRKDPLEGWVQIS